MSHFLRSTRLSRFAGKALLLALLAVCLAPRDSRAYVIFLKDGSRIEVRDKPVVQGKSWIFVIPSGNRQSIPISEVDEKKTDEFNKMGLGDSYLLSDDKRKIVQQADPKKPSLSEYIKANKKAEIKDRSPVTVAPETRAKPADAARPASQAAQAPGNAGGGVPIDSIVSDAFTRALEGAGVRGARVSPAGRSLRVQAVTENEQQVFAAIGAAARGLKESRASGRELEKVELVLSTTSGENAGRFNITPGDADALLNGKISASKFFVSNVIF